MPKWPYGFVGRQADRLRDADLRALFRGSPREEINGLDFVGSTYLHDGDGNWREVAPSNHAIVLASGTNVIKGDMLCLRSEAVYMGREICSEVYRNPGGSPETHDEYLRTDLYRARYSFSIKPPEKE